MLAKYNTSFLRRTKSAQCSFIFCSFTLREFTVSSLGKRLVISVSQRQGVNGLVNSQQNVRFGIAGKLERLPIEQVRIVLASFIMTATRNSPGYPS